jgi:hypothetical protein
LPKKRARRSAVSAVTPRRHADSNGQTILTQVQWLDEFLLQYFARMNRVQIIVHHLCPRSAIIHDPDVAYLTEIV